NRDQRRHRATARRPYVRAWHQVLWAHLYGREEDRLERWPQGPVVHLQISVQLTAVSGGMESMTDPDGLRATTNPSLHSLVCRMPLSLTSPQRGGTSGCS